MTPDAAALFAVIILVVPMAYLLFAAPGFLFVKLDIPPVARLLRMMFGAYFLVLTVTAIIGAVMFAVAGPWDFVFGIGVLASTVIARGWFLRRIDAQIDTWPADVGRRLRRLHCGGMLCNAIQLAVVMASIPYVMSTPI